MKKNEVFEVVAGTRVAPGAILAVFPVGAAYKCGGPATACLRAWARLAYTSGTRNGVAVFFRRRSV